MSTIFGIPGGKETMGPSPSQPVAAASAKPRRFAAWKGLRALASLQLTVVLFALSLIVVFFGTMDQIDQSNWTAQKQYFRSWMVRVPFKLISQFVQIFYDHDAPTWSGYFPFLGGRTLGVLMLVNLLAAHLTRFKLSWRRSGVIILHLGVLILLGGEIVTQFFAVESRLIMQVGESKNSIDRSREFELALTDDASGQTAVIPEGLLAPGKTVSSPELPVDVQVLEVYKNSIPHSVTGGDDSNTIVSVVTGAGGRYEVVSAPEGSGVKSEQREDIPAVRFRVLEKGTQKVLGEHLSSLWEYEDGPAFRHFIALPFKVSAGGRTYTISLRNERIYKPYTITLLKFEHKNYAGTEMAKDFASTVRLQDSETGEDREVRIWMNHPLRHRGETFYQSGTLGSDSASGEVKDTGTVLQVVNNPGWLLPYVSCFVVTLGMFIHFGIAIVNFTNKRRARWNQNAGANASLPKPSLPEANASSWAAKYVPWAVIGVCAVYSVKMLFPGPETYNDFDLSAFGAIPVLDEGRVKPLDTLARTKMLYISGQSEFQDQDGKKHPAILWLLEILAAEDPNTSVARDFPVFRIDNEQVLQLLNLKFKPGFYRYSVNELLPNYEKFATAVRAAENLDENKRELFHAKLIELASRITAYNRIVYGAAPNLIPKERGSDQWVTLGEIEKQASLFISDDQRSAARKAAANEVIAEWGARLPEKLTPELQQALMADVDKRASARLARLSTREWGKVNPAAGAFQNILSAYREKKPKGFIEAIHTYTSDYVYPLNPEFTNTTSFEQRMNQANPLIVAAFLFIFAAIFRMFAWLVWEQPLSRIAWGLAVIGLALLVGTLFGRMYIMQRPLVFVTNLYSTALLIGAGMLAGGLCIERIFKNGIGLIVGVLAAASGVDIAHHLSTDGRDTMGALVAVLDTNYWLASHVTTVNLGYAATYLAGLLSIAYLVWGLAFSNLTKEKHAALGSMIYGTLCFAMTLSFVGTVLGGIWGDQSWGRFWGWDPKENGAVMIVIWNALILHARWCGLVKQRGMALLSIAGIMITTWSYFGTNQLGAGLHNYGFNKDLADGCAVTWAVCLGLIGLGLIPMRFWRSFAGTGQPKPELTSASPDQRQTVPAFSGRKPGKK
jgi:ABC-type transport system involved in cytochrome c biogenesis permease subunit